MLELQGRSGIRGHAIAAAERLQRVRLAYVWRRRVNSLSALFEYYRLAQAEAVADLIEASTETAAKSAVRSLSGGFNAHSSAGI